MPEGPEIRRAADRVAEALVNKHIVDAVLTPPKLRHFGRRLQGSLVTAVDTRGKAMLTRFDNDLTLYSHNQLYGRWYTTRRPEIPDTSRQLRVALHNDSHSAFLYSASDIEVLNAGQLASHPFLSRIGPDILDTALTREHIVTRLRLRAFRRRALGGLYLDQAFLAGVGNYLRSEILWASRLAPTLRPVDLTAKQCESLARETLIISRRSYATCGFTVPSSLARELKAAGLTFEERRFQVFERDGQNCHACGTVVRRDVMGSRNVFTCPNCQPC